MIDNNKIEPYKPLTQPQKDFNVKEMQGSGFNPITGQYILFPVSGLLASGEANYYDRKQSPEKRLYVLNDDATFAIPTTIPPGTHPHTNANLIITLPFNYPSGDLYDSNVLKDKPYSSGEVVTGYIISDPDGGQGAIDKNPYGITFDSSSSLIKTPKKQTKTTPTPSGA